MNFIDIENLIGCSLPNSARKHRQWWANQIKPAPENRQCAALLNARYKVGNVDIQKEKVTFMKNKNQLGILSHNTVDGEIKKE